jgi:hypothetical protein
MKPIVAMILAVSVAGCLTSADNYAAENGSNGRTPAGQAGLTVSQSEIPRLAATIRDQVSRCWKPPAGLAGGPTVRVVFELNQDGTLARPPVVRPENSGDPQDAEFQAAAKTALRAVRSCTPLRLPAAQYRFWESVEMKFDPREMRSSPDPEKR